MKLKDCIMGIPVRYTNNYKNPEEQPTYEKKQVGHIVGFTWNFSNQTLMVVRNWNNVEPLVLVQWCGESVPSGIHPTNIERLT